jgi:hypothetical protein
MSQAVFLKAYNRRLLTVDCLVLKRHFGTRVSTSSVCLAHQKYTLLVLFILGFECTRNLVKFKQRSHPIVIQRLATFDIFLFLTNLVEPLLALFDIIKAHHVFSPEPFQFVFLACQEFISRLDAKNQVSLEFCLCPCQVLDVAWDLVVVHLQSIPLMLCHTATQHHD